MLKVFGFRRNTNERINWTYFNEGWRYGSWVSVWTLLYGSRFLFWVDYYIEIVLLLPRCVFLVFVTSTVWRRPKVTRVRPGRSQHTTSASAPHERRSALDSAGSWREKGLLSSLPTRRLSDHQRRRASTLARSVWTSEVLISAVSKDQVFCLSTFPSPKYSKPSLKT